MQVQPPTPSPTEQRGEPRLQCDLISLDLHELVASQPATDSLLIRDLDRAVLALPEEQREVLLGPYLCGWRGLVR